MYAVTLVLLSNDEISEIMFIYIEPF